MRVEIRKNDNMEPVIIITFHTNPQAFASDYERSKFFRELHGWQQSVSKNDRRYVYHRAGLLDEMPHAKIADSVFMTVLDNMERVEKFFDEWHKKVEVEMMQAMMDKSLVEKMMKRRTENNI